MVQLTQTFVIVLIAMVSGFWTYDKYNHDKINRKCGELLSKEIYERDLKHTKELVEEKHNRILEAISDLNESIKKIELYLKDSLEREREVNDRK